MSRLDDQFWKPDQDTLEALSDYDKRPKRLTAKQKRRLARKRKQAEKKKAREDLINHFGLQKFASNMAICLCIHKEHGTEIPKNEVQAKKIILKCWRGLNGIRSRHRYMSGEQFYSSSKWRELRYIALYQSGGRCALCGAKASDGAVLHVDHIRPRSKYPKLQFDLDNLQVLCQDCNIGKSNYDDTDWR